MNAELISVVVPCYNAGRYIAGSLRSVLAQTSSPLEIIVVDDGSSDGSADLVRREFPDVVVLSQANQGAAAARNLGIRHARGEWVAFLDADDLWLPGKLEAQSKCIAASSGTRMVYTGWQEWTSEVPEPSPEQLAGVISDSQENKYWDGPSGWIYTQLLVDCVVWTSTVIVHRSLFDEIGPFDVELRLGQDYDFWLRASRVTPIIKVPLPYALYRKHPSNSTNKAHSENYRAIVIERALNRWGYVGPDGAKANPREVKRVLAKSWSDFGQSHLRVGNLKRAREAARQATGADWRHIAGWRLQAKAVFSSVIKREGNVNLPSADSSPKLD